MFSFPGRNPTPVAATPIAPTTPTIETATTTSNDDVMLELTQDDEASELVLDGDDILTTPVGSVPVGPPADDEAMPLDTHMEVEIDKPKLASGGGTLFERMSNIARGAAQAEATDGEAPAIRREPLDIPRFLNRQNNQ